MSIATVAVHVNNVTKRFGRTLALNGVSFEIPAGQVFGLLGPNGAGKSTLISILTTLLTPDEGSVHVFGSDVRIEPQRIRRLLGVVFQEGSLDGRLTTYENLHFHGLIYGLSGRNLRSRIDQLLDLLALAEYRDRLVRQLSTGLKRRLELARALLHHSQLVILDEPTVGLDTESREKLWEYILLLKDQEASTVLLTTHYIHEAEVADKVCIIDKGSILAIDSPSELRRQFGARFLIVTPRDDTATNDILVNYGTKARKKGDGIVIDAEASDAVERFLTVFGNRVRSVSIEMPSLESVFLSLTGSSIESQPQRPLRGAS